MTEIPEPWLRAAERAKNASLRPIKLDEGRYLLPSVSGAAGTFHTVHVFAGKIVFCDCLGWRGRRKPCQHAGAVADLMLAEKAPEKDP